jgi:two-component system sensor histidine kinase DesK
MSLRLKSLQEVVRNKDHGWSPLFSLVYLVFFFIQPFYDHASVTMWICDILAVAVFLFLYLGLFFLEKPRPILHLCGIVLLGVVTLPFNSSACTFFIYAAAMSPFVVQTQGAAVRCLLAIAALGAAENLLLRLNGWSLFFSSVFPLFIGGGNVFFAERNRMHGKLRKANEEIEHLAKVAERERIARDLHDVLGHTLSVITLKSELAGKLMERDPERAGKEIREVEEISRQALSDVRVAIGGYRSAGLVAELARAKATLETAGVNVQCDAATTMKLPAMQESVLSLAVREAVTNVVRHAQARNCRLRVEQQNGSCRLEIHDDGLGCGDVEGNGLRGMRERVEMMGGTIERCSASGTALTIILPLKEAALKEAALKDAPLKVEGREN